MNITEIVRRSSLIMSVNQPRFVEKASLRGADAIVLDLEEGVAGGTISVNGRMIDIPIAAKARRILARANAIAAKEARKDEALRMAGVA